MVTWGACGHPLYPYVDDLANRTRTPTTPWCRVCWTAEQTTEAINARLVKEKPRPRSVFRVTSVTPPPGTYGPGDYGPDSFGGSDFPELADASGFVPGMAVDFFDGSGARAEERERWRGREAEANAWYLSTPGPIGGMNASSDLGSAMLDAALARERRRHVGEVDPPSWDAIVERAEAFAHHAPGHRRREVDAAVARLCPPRSRGGPPEGCLYMGQPVPDVIMLAILDANPHLHGPHLDWVPRPCGIPAAVIDGE